jgi:hypothetical protein
MKIEQLLAVALWMDELEAEVAAAARKKWAALDELTLDQGHTSLQAYVDRDAELDAVMVQPLRDRLAVARRLLVERATMLAASSSWPAGGSWLARAYALAKSVAANCDASVVEAELVALRLGS